jgi:hypothetical protein
VRKRDCTYSVQVQFFLFLNIFYPWVGEPTDVETHIWVADYPSLGSNFWHLGFRKSLLGDSDEGALGDENDTIYR